MQIPPDDYGGKRISAALPPCAGGDFSQREKKYFKSPVDNRENAVYLNSHICRMNIKIVFSIP